MPYITVHDHDIQNIVAEKFLDEGEGYNFCTLKFLTKRGATICFFFRDVDVPSVEAATLLLNNRPSVTNTTKETTDE